LQLLGDVVEEPQLARVLLGDILLGLLRGARLALLRLLGGALLELLGLAREGGGLALEADLGVHLREPLGRRAVLGLGLEALLLVGRDRPGLPALRARRAARARRDRAVAVARADRRRARPPVGPLVRARVVAL